MSTSTGYNTIKQSHALGGDPQALRECYQEWAPRYDDDVAAQHYLGPQIIADITQDAVEANGPAPMPDLRFLDAGCGTGLVGVQLRRIGATKVAGFDLSPDMVERATQTGAYDLLRAGVDMHKPLEPLFSQGRYDVVVSCGVFTLGHVRPDALYHLVDAVYQRGLVVISARSSYLDAEPLEKHIAGLVEQDVVSLCNRYDNAPYINEESASYFVLRRKTAQNNGAGHQQ
jgi:predicted TPR repeat methyltransferase